MGRGIEDTVTSLGRWLGPASPNAIRFDSDAFRNHVFDRGVLSDSINDLVEVGVAVAAGLGQQLHVLALQLEQGPDRFGLQGPVWSDSFGHEGLDI